jgi:hypothetical protein
MGRQSQSKSEKWKHPVLTTLTLAMACPKENSRVKRSQFKHILISKIKRHGCSLVPMQIMEHPKITHGFD